MAFTLTAPPAVNHFTRRSATQGTPSLASVFAPSCQRWQSGESFVTLGTGHRNLPDDPDHQHLPRKEAAYHALAQAQGLSVEQWLTQLLQQVAPSAPLDTPDKDDRPLSAMFAETWADMPDEVRVKLPSDGADQHDHYIYGTPKRAV